MFQRTIAINKLLKLTKRKRVVPGGTWAGKTYDILAIEIDHLIKNPKQDTTVVAETIPAIKHGALKDFMEIMRDTNRWNPDGYNATDRIYRFSNGSVIQFTAFDSEDKARQAGKRNRLFVNEVNTIPKPIVDALMIRTEDVIWMDYNPTSPFWVNEELTFDPDCEWITLTYMDNGALPDTILKELMKRREKARTSSFWQNWWNVYGLGLTGALQDVIFNDWTIIDTIPEDARYTGTGLDFGYSNDPSSAVDRYVMNDAVIYDEVLYRTGLTNRDIAGLVLSEDDLKRTVYADNSEPKSIKELNIAGLRTYPAPKGQDSIRFGIGLMQEKTFRVTARSLNLIKELRNYTWQKDKDGELTQKPIDAFNHAIDACRYVEASLTTRPITKVRSSSIF